MDRWMGTHLGERVPPEVYVIPHPITAAFFLFFFPLQYLLLLKPTFFFSPRNNEWKQKAQRR